MNNADHKVVAIHELLKKHHAVMIVCDTLDDWKHAQELRDFHFHDKEISQLLVTRADNHRARFVGYHNVTWSSLIPQRQTVQRECMIPQ